jgi:hypothetical protein
MITKQSNSSKELDENGNEYRRCDVVARRPHICMGIEAAGGSVFGPETPVPSDMTPHLSVLSGRAPGDREHGPTQ